ncbi:uncharacterized protein LOC142323713 isoform X2 [Lycorma delicatula]|uniref:uncharacterized protein LOC142323713 isoform X2 n=1 Tax=Lycorma delicatula TaxID=130591 RepID=UPI003F50D8C2
MALDSLELANDYYFFEQARMVLILPEYSQRPYRYGMTLLCVGAMFNWLGLAENNAEPVRYIGVTLIAAGAMLICLAMCFWMKASHDPPGESSQNEEPLHHIVTIHQSGAPIEKPPDYDSVTGCLPPCYEEAIRLNPSLLLPNISTAQDVTDSRKQEADIPPGVSQNLNNIPAPPYSQACTVNITTDSLTLKNNDVINGKSSSTGTSDIVVTTNEAATNTVEDSSQNSQFNNDNFGSKVLRLSKRLLRGKRVSSLDGESSNNSNSTMSNSSTSNAAAQTTAATISTPDSQPPSLTSENDSSPSTSNLPVR